MAVLAERLRERVAVADAGEVDVVQYEVGIGEQIRQGFVFPADDVVSQGGALGDGAGLSFEVFERGGEVATGTASRVEDDFAELGGGEFDEELGDGAWSVILAEGFTSALQFAQKAFVDLAEYLLIFAAVEVDGVEFVDDLAQVDARFHVVVVIGEDFAHEQGAFVAAGEVDIGEGGEEFLIDKFYELIAGDAFVVTRPLVPVQLCGDGRAVVVLQQLQLFIFIAEYFQK